MSNVVIAQGWQTRPLIEVATLQRGYDLPIQDRTDGPFPIYAANGPLGFHGLAKCKGPGVITGRSGTIGKVHFVEGDYWPLNTSLYVKDFHGNAPRWVYYLLQSFGLERFSQGAGVPTLNRNLVHGEPINLPPLPEQRRIAAILDQADALCTKRREALAQLDYLEDSLFQEFQKSTQSVCEQVPLSTLAANARGSFVNGPFGSDLLTSELQEEGVPVVYIRDIRDGEYRRVSMVCVSEQKAQSLNVCNVEPGDVLVAKVGDPPGVSAVYPVGEPSAIVTQDVIRIRPNLDIVLPEFIKAYLNSSTGRWKISEITVEATRARFSLGDFKKLQVALPELSSQREFVTEISSLRSLKASHEASILELNSLFTSLQHRAFRGEL